jgi:hypothetical protein
MSVFSLDDRASALFVGSSDKNPAYLHKTVRNILVEGKLLFAPTVL